MVVFLSAFPVTNESHALDVGENKKDDQLISNNQHYIKQYREHKKYKGQSKKGNHHGSYKNLSL